MRYDSLFEEPICAGKSYSEYCKQFNIVIPKTGSFERIHNFDLRKVGLKKLDFVLKRKEPS